MKNRSSRQNCTAEEIVYVFRGERKKASEATDALIMRLASTVGSEIQISDIDGSHRLGIQDCSETDLEILL